MDPSKGVAVWNGKVYVGTLDERLVALDSATGKRVWEKVTVDTTKPYTITGAPRVIKGKVIVGSGGAERPFAAGIPVSTLPRARL